MFNTFSFFNWFHMGNESVRGCGLFGNTMMGGSFMMIIYGALIIFLVYLIVSKLSINKTVSANTSALEVLDKEFAKGNIDEEEYIRKRDLLK